MKENKPLLLILVVALLVKAALLLFSQRPEGDDGLRYLRTGMNIVQSGVFSADGYGNFGYQPDPRPTAHDLPLYPLILAGIYSVTGSPAATQRIAVGFNIVLAFVGLWFLLKIVSGPPFLFDARQQAVSAAVFLFMPESVIYSLCHMPDMMAVVFCVIAIWAYYRSVYERIGWIFVSAAAFSAASYSKPICIPLAFAILISRLIYHSNKVSKKMFINGGLAVVVAIGVYVALFIPWYNRNERVFGTGGITTIAGTNLYSDNLSRYVNSLPDGEKRSRLLAEMHDFEQTLNGYDLMRLSKIKAEFAKSKILEDFWGYTIWTLKTHPRMYAGCGVAAIFRFLGYEKGAYVLQGEESFRAAGREIPSITLTDRIVALSIQVGAWVMLLACYVVIAVGGCRCLAGIFKSTAGWSNRLGYALPILSLILLAAVIGPIVTTRYRFIMIPFFALLSGSAFVARRYSRC